MSGALFLLAYAIPSSRAEVWELSGSSLRDVAMAGAGAAGSAPGSALTSDPATLSDVDGELSVLAWRGTRPHVQVDGEPLFDDATDGVDVAIALGRPLPAGFRAGAGFAFYLPLPQLVDAAVHMSAGDAQAPFLEDAADLGSFAGAVGLGWGHVRIAAGALVGAGLEADTDIVLVSLAAEHTEDGEDLTDGVAVGLERHIVWKAAPLVGVHVEAGPLAAYASARGATGFPTQGDTAFGHALGPLFPTPSEEPIPIDYLSASSPSRVAAGLALRAGPFRPEVAIRRLLTSSFVDTQSRSPEPAFDDTWVPAGGLEWLATERLFARAGYAWWPSPIPEQQSTHFADSDRHVLGLGAALDLPDFPREGDRSAVEAAVQFQRLVERQDGPDDGRWTTTGDVRTMSAGLRTDF